MNIEVGTKFKFENLGEVMHLLEFDKTTGEFVAAVNSSEVCIDGNWGDIPSDQIEILTDTEYQAQLVAFWSNGECTGKRVEY